MGRRQFLLVALALVLADPFEALAIDWNQVINTRALHDANIPGTDHPHFTLEWRTTGSWNGSEGYYRWTIIPQSEDSDGYWIQHPNTTANNVYVSFIMRVGPDWWNHISNAEEFKFAMFYPVSTPPRPTLFNWHVRSGTGSVAYKVFAPAADANGEGHQDEFGNSAPDYGYPNHTYREDSSGHDQWYFVVFGIVGNRTRLWIWSQDGQISGDDGYLAQSAEKTGGYNETWDMVGVLAYIEQTIGGSANAYIDMCHLSVHNALPSPPAGFVDGNPDPAPAPASNLRIIRTSANEPETERELPTLEAENRQVKPPHATIDVQESGRDSERFACRKTEPVIWRTALAWFKDDGPVLSPPTHRNIRPPRSFRSTKAT